MANKIDREALEQEKSDIQNLIAELEESYRRAEISEKNYEELSRKYADRLTEIGRALGTDATVKSEAKKESKETISEDSKEHLEELPEENPQKEDKIDKKDVKKTGLFSRLIGKKSEEEEKEEKKDDEKKVEKKNDEPTEVDLGNLDPSSPEAIEKLAAAAATNAGVDTTEVKEDVQVDDTSEPKDIEIEKIKLMIETLREGQKSTDESIRNLAESIGEIRSMVFTEDSSIKEEGAKMERIETEIGEIKPKEIENRFREFRTKMEQTDLGIEKLERKSEDLAEKVNMVYEMMKKIGGVENLITIDKDIQKKIDDIKEALKYTERLALKTEKMFIDINREIQDIVIYKTRQEGLDESVRDLIKGMDAINARMNDVITKKDLDTVKQDILLMHNHLEEIQKVLPLLEAKIPETIVALREERRNIMLFLDSLSEHYKSRTINLAEYEEAKRKNMAKLAKIEEQLREEWKNLESTIAAGMLPKEQTTQEGGEVSGQQNEQSQEKPDSSNDSDVNIQETKEEVKKPEESESDAQEEKQKKKRTRRKKVIESETASQSIEANGPVKTDDVKVEPQYVNPKMEEEKRTELPKNSENSKKVNVRETLKTAHTQTPLFETKTNIIENIEKTREGSEEQKEAEAFVGSAVARLASNIPNQISSIKSESLDDKNLVEKVDMEDLIKKVREKMR
jgi:hypothetical protein